MTPSPFDRDTSALAGRCAALAGLGDAELGARLLRATPTHENRPDGVLGTWARTAVEVGRELADAPSPAAGVRVREASGGVGAGEIVLAEYHHRSSEVVLRGDALELAGALVELAGWEAWFPPERVREAAVWHELAHRMLHGAPSRDLRRRLDHRVAGAGRFRLRGHVAGADEVVAHTVAHRRSGLGRSPMLLTLGLAEALPYTSAGRARPRPYPALLGG
ncbi:hypothetical protein [Actinorugispora endophytica]|uniref:Uncharacterized protein n=1 Tax=Actinorugispora endophytica TaxID=1605990 RepID=A0A4R6UHM2_9ACTN|nr:hypothetical protein [Actinorugispora endophytica]TDQ46370.1 hypothetical protein EV190_12557 [Actinorugispora endophytica]